MGVLENELVAQLKPILGKLKQLHKILLTKHKLQHGDKNLPRQV